MAWRTAWHLTLTLTKVLGVYGGGVADRVALDFTTLLEGDEGALVGSAATELVLTLALALALTPSQR